MTLKDLESDARLGLRALVVRPWQRLWQSPGIERFRRNFYPEGLVPTGIADRAWLLLAARCIGCGLCDCAPGGGPNPSLLPTAWSKASADLSHLRESLAACSLDRLALGEALCPTRVPLRRLHRALSERLDVVAALSAGESQ